eukprot:scaffold5466_cov108-Skeletonema_menzelii.AAC.1
MAYCCDKSWYCWGEHCAQLSDIMWCVVCSAPGILRAYSFPVSIFGEAGIAREKARQDLGLIKVRCQSDNYPPLQLQ